MNTLSFFLAPFCMCLILLGIHCYLGLHVLRRGVIFIDLSLAQVAALGSTIGLLFHLEDRTFLNYLLSLSLTLLASWFFSYARKNESRISQEAIIGIVYAFASSTAILVAHYLPHGAEHLKEVLIGRLLWVSWEEVIKTALLYGVISFIHYKLRHKMFNLSHGKPVSNQTLWDFIFFGLFGFVITSSVHTAGVLLVFSFLIVPALTSSLIFKTVKMQLFAGWLLGLIVCSFGMYLSYIFDLPSGAFLVSLFTVIPILTVLLLKKLPIKP